MLLDKTKYLMPKFRACMKCGHVVLGHRPARAWHGCELCPASQGASSHPGVWGEDSLQTLDLSLLVFCCEVCSLWWFLRQGTLPCCATTLVSMCFNLKSTNTVSPGSSGFPYMAAIQHCCWYRFSMRIWTWGRHTRLVHLQPLLWNRAPWSRISG